MGGIGELGEYCAGVHDGLYMSWEPRKCKSRNIPVDEGIDLYGSDVNSTA